MRNLLQRLFVHETNATLILLFRYGFVAIAALAVDFGGLVLLREVVGLHYLVAATISFCAGATVNFLLSIDWVFRNSRISQRHYEFAAFVIIGAVGLALNDLILWLLTSAAGLFYVYSKIIATVLVFFWNFFIRKWLLYPQPKPKQTAPERSV